MALYVVISLEDSAPTVKAAIEEKCPNDFYEIKNGTWFVKSNLPTSKKLSDFLGLTDDDDSKPQTTSVVVNIRGHYGFAPLDFWEWTAAKADKPKTNE